MDGQRSYRRPQNGPLLLCFSRRFAVAMACYIVVVVVGEYFVGDASFDFAYIVAPRQKDAR